jgi:hypothetical protein
MDPLFPPRRRPSLDDYRPLTLVRPEPSDATATRALRDLMAMQEQARRAGAGSMGVPSGLRGPSVGELLGIGADVLTPGPVGAGTVISGLADMLRGDVRGGAGKIGADLAIGLSTAGVGSKVKAARKLKKLADVTDEAARSGRVAASNLTDQSVATVFDDMNAAEALQASLRGEHLKQNPTTGQYIGAPRGVDSPQKLGAMRSQVDQKVEGGLSNAAWYTRARDTAEDVSGFQQGMDPLSEEGRMASLFARSGAAYSPQATPPTEINAMLRQHNAKVLRGDDITPRTGAQARNVATAYVYNPVTGGFTLEPARIRLGKKTGPYADAKDPTVPEDELYKTANDIWHGRVFGYQGSKNNPDALFSRGFTPQEHGFLTGENLLVAERAQRAGLLPPGYSSFTWSPRAAQAATWGAERFQQMLEAQNAMLAKYQKDMAKFDRAKAKGKKATRPTAPKLLTLQEMRAKANAGIDDAARRQVAAITAEFAPGSTSGMYEGFGALPAEAQEQFARESLAATGERNPLLSAFQMFQEPTRVVRGQWTDPATGEITQSVTDVARPLVGMQSSVLGRNAKGNLKRGGPMMDDASRGGLEVQSAIEGVIRGQQGVGLGKFTPQNSSMKGSEKTGAHVMGNPNDLAQAKAALEAAGLNIMDYGDTGFYVGRYADSDFTTPGTVWNTTVDGKDVQKVIKQTLTKLKGNYEITPGRLESGLTTVPWGEEGSGQVARFLDETLNRPDVINAAQRLDVAGVPAMLDARRAVAQRVLGPQAAANRPDVQRLLDLLSASSGGGFRSFQDYVRRQGYQGLPAVGLMAGGAGAMGMAGAGPRNQNER